MDRAGVTEKQWEVSRETTSWRAAIRQGQVTANWCVNCLTQRSVRQLVDATPVTVDEIKKALPLRAWSFCPRDEETLAGLGLTDTENNVTKQAGRTARSWVEELELSFGA